MTNLLNLSFSSQMQWIVVLIAVDVLLGVVGALMKKEFVLGKVGGFMKKAVLPYVLGFGVLVTVANGLPSLSIVVKAAYILVILALLGSILNNLKKLGLPVPKILGKE